MTPQQIVLVRSSFDQVLPAHCAVVGQALLDTLQTGLGPTFTIETREAWSTADGMLSSVMIAAAASHGKATPA